jgi:hypothetical protein
VRTVTTVVLVAVFALNSPVAAIQSQDSTPQPPGIIPVRIPDTVASFIGRGRRNFEDPRDGVGLRYEHPASSLFADIYIYPGPDLKTDCPLACASGHLAREITDFEAFVPGRMTQSAFAQAARVTASEAVTPPRGARWQLGHHVAAVITRDGRELRSEFYLFYLPGYRVKFRSTFVDTPARSEALDAFVKAVLQGLPAPP